MGLSERFWCHPPWGSPLTLLATGAERSDQYEKCGSLSVSLLSSLPPSLFTSMFLFHFLPPPLSFDIRHIGRAFFGKEIDRKFLEKDVLSSFWMQRQGPAMETGAGKTETTKERREGLPSSRNCSTNTDGCGFVEKASP